MFTGIIEEVGIVQTVIKGIHSIELKITAPKILNSNVQIGESIAVNGVCLTVTKIEKKQFTADAMPETLLRTNLDRLVRGSEVNLERALPLNGRLGGHLVSGHIDNIGKICSITQDENSVRIKIEVKPEILKFIVEKGSVTINGISLTVSHTDSDLFEVAVIPHTHKYTTLSSAKVGDILNIEIDLIMRYLSKLMTNNQQYASVNTKSDKKITFEQLLEDGF